MVLRAPVELGRPERLEQSARAAVWIGVRSVERFRADNGRLPATLAEAGEDDLEVEYRLDGDRYTVTGTVGTYSITYRSGDSLAPFLAVFPLVPGAP